MITPIKIDQGVGFHGWGDTLPGRHQTPLGAHIVFNNSRKITALKWVRACFGYGLKEAKDYVELCKFRGDFWIPVDDIPYEITEVDEDDIFAEVVKKKVTRL